MARLARWSIMAAEVLALVSLARAVCADAEVEPGPRGPLLTMVIALVTAFVLSLVSRQRGLLRRLHDVFLENSWETTLRYVFYLRFQLAVTLAMLLFPPLAVLKLRRLMDSLFYVRPDELFYVTWMALLTAWSLMVSFQLVCAHGPRRFGGEALQPRAWLIRYGRPWKEEIFALLTGPTLGFCVACSQHKWGCVLAILAGLAVAWLTLFVIAWQREMIVPNCIPPATLLLDGAKFRWLRWNRDCQPEPMEAGLITERLLRILGPGYYDQERGCPLPGHMLAMTLLAMVLCIYGLLGFSFRPCGGWNDRFPSLGYVMIMFMLMAWGLSAAAFFLDRWRTPVTMAIVSGALVLYALSETDHYYVTRPASSDLVAQAASLTPQEALTAWMERVQPQSDRMTVVVISGGGIAAAAWGSEVLTGLEAEIGAPFTQSLHALSSASGGSVAVMYYLDGFQRAAPRPAAELARVREASAHSSLRAMAWGVAYPDVWRFFAPPLLKCFPNLDRGWALQEAWRSQLRHPDMTLLGWRAQVAKGSLPVALLDSTAVESGRQFLLTPVDVAGPGTGRHFRSHHSFLNLYEGRDLDVVAAARLSATFPWVTPISRASLDAGGPDFHLADGAYLDNYGMTTMVQWLNAIFPTYAARHRRPHVLLVRISIRQPDFVDDVMYDAKPGWQYTTVGPLLTLMNASQASQIARNDQLFELLRDRWTRSPSGPDGIDLQVANFVLRSEAPLSWQLTDAARRAIRRRWQQELAEGDDLKTVRRFFAQPVPAVLAGGRFSSSQK